MPTFTHPYFLALLPAVLLAAWFIYRKQRRAAMVFSATARIPSHTMTWRITLSRVLPLFFLTGLALAILALAGPRAVLSKTHRTTDAIAMEMVVDVSGSMDALDLSEFSGNQLRKERSRLAAVKEVFAGFIERRPDDLIGLITFGGYAATRTPLTLDHQAILHVLSGVEIAKPAIGRGGQILDPEESLTAIGDALATACARLQNTEAKSRIIVLLTDGVSNAGIIPPEDAMRGAQELGIKVYTIGIGTTGEAPFWVKDMLNRRVIKYQQVELDDTLLKNIAETTDGQYFNVRDAKGLEHAIKHIDKLEKTEIERDTYYHYRELFPRFLAPGLILIALGLILNMLTARRLV